MTKREREKLIDEMLEDEDVDEQKLFDLYMDYITEDAEEADDICGLEFVHVPVRVVEGEDERGNYYCDEVVFYKKTEIEDFFTEEHRRDLKDTIIWVFESWAGVYD